MKIFTIIIFYATAVVFMWEIMKGNVALAIVAATILFIDYHMWLRGSKSLIFTDKTQIEKDLREIQKLEAKRRLKELKGIVKFGGGDESASN